jgi:hypothetical protein
MKKVIGIVVVLAVIVVGVGIWMLLSNLNSLVAKVIEDEGSKVTETSVRVSGVNIKLREGRGSIDNLAIASPAGYDADKVFSLGNITVDIDVKSVRDDPIVIDEIRISAPEVHAEFNDKGESNVDEIRKRVQAYSAGSGGGGGEGGGSGGEEKKIRIRSFVFEKGVIGVDASALGVEKRTVNLPEFRLTNVGGSSGGTPDEIAKEIAGAVTKQVTSQIAKSEAKKLIEDKLGGSIEDKAKGLLDKITN